MKLKLMILLISLVTFFKTTACCSDSSYRLIPIGEINKEIVFVELRLSKDSIFLNSINESFLKVIKFIVPLDRN